MSSTTGQIASTDADQASEPRPTGMAIWLVVAGVVGWYAAFSLLVERIHLLQHPEDAAACDFSVLVQCTANLQSWQGAVFGFPNPVLGIAGWVAPVVVGVAVLAGARFARWFWVLFWAGMAFAFGFVCWLVSQSVFVLGTLCPWCMVTWVVTIPSFYLVTLHLFRARVLPVPARVADAAARLVAWVPLAAILSYAVVVLLAQLQLDAIPNVWRSLFG